MADKEKKNEKDKKEKKPLPPCKAQVNEDDEEAAKQVEILKAKMRIKK
jgi:hypothetical protein